MCGRGVADLVPLHSGLSVVAVGRDLHRCPRTMFVVPAQLAYPLGRPAVSPQLQPVWLDGMHAKLGLLAAADPLRPGVSQQTIGKEPKLMRSGGGEHNSRELRSKAWLL